MKSKLIISGVICVILCSFFIKSSEPIKENGSTEAADTLIITGEKHFKNMRMLTNGGENAEAYFSFDGSKIIFQTTRPPYDCDQIFIMNTDGSDQHLVSTGKGRTTCSYFYPDGKSILYASTHMGGDNCPPKPDHSKGYVGRFMPIMIFTKQMLMAQIC
jgi:Tol biopolymer transport system component